MELYPASEADMQNLFGYFASRTADAPNGEAAKYFQELSGAPTLADPEIVAVVGYAAVHLGIDQLSTPLPMLIPAIDRFHMYGEDPSIPSAPRDISPEKEQAYAVAVAAMRLINRFGTHANDIVRSRTTQAAKQPTPNGRT